MKLNWKKRLNVVFGIQVILSIATPILGYFGLTYEELTTWSKVGEVIIEAIKNPYVVSLIVVSLWNAMNNPTVKGLGDKEE